jgi:hypothetical protein
MFRSIISIVLVLSLVLPVFSTAPGYAASAQPADYRVGGEKSPAPEKPLDGKAPDAPLDGSLANEYLTVSIIDTGQFTLLTADGRYLLFSGAGTSYLSVMVDGYVYENDSGSLAVVTPLTITDPTHAFIEYLTPELILVRQNFALNGEAVKISLDVNNTGTVPHSVSARYLLDTQINTNDGSPLYASTVGVRTYETDILIPAFNSWQGYDVWPNPTLASLGTFATQPNRVVFAYWPNAVGYTWDYTVNPNLSFQSDSCVLLYYNLGLLLGSEQETISTYYGVGEPTADTERERLISAFQTMKEAIKSSMIADLDAFSGLQARYFVSLRNDWRDYVEAAWTIIDFAAPDPADLAKLGKDAKVVSELLDLVDAVDLGQTFGKEIAELRTQIPATATEAQVKNDYIYARFYDQAVFEPESGGSYMGVEGYLETIEQDYQNAIASIPDPLPAGYPVDEVIDVLRRQTAALNASAYSETNVLVVSGDACSLAKLGVLQNQQVTMEELAERLEAAADLSFAATVTEIGIVVGAGVVKVAGVVGAPVTVGGSTIVIIPSEVALWGSVAALTTAFSVFGAIGDISGLSTQGTMTTVSYSAMAQMANDLALRQQVFISTKDWILSPSATSLLEINKVLEGELISLDALQAPNISVPADQSVGHGSGTAVIRNISAEALQVSVHGTLTTMLGEQMQIVGLVGSQSYAINPGESRSVAFDMNVLRSTLVDSAGYDLHLYVTAATSNGSVDIQGPFVTHFYVGTAGQLSALTAQTFTTLQRISLANGETYSLDTTFAPGTQVGRVMLSFVEGADQDLHLYDSYGNHVGVNYSTGQVELQIPGAKYSGANAFPEWIEVANPGSQTYSITLIGQNTAAGAGADLSRLETPLLPVLFDAPALVNWYASVEEGTSTALNESYAFQVSEGGGSQNVSNLSATPSDLADGSGHSIPANQVYCQAPNPLLAGTSALVECDLTISASLPAGDYSGVVTLNGQDGVGNPLTLTTGILLHLEKLSTSSGIKLFLPFAIRQLSSSSTIYEEFNSASSFIQTDPDVYIDGGQVHWYVSRSGGTQYVYRSIPSFSGDVRLTVRGQVNSWSNNCFIHAGIGNNVGDGVSVNYGFFGGGCTTNGTMVMASGTTMDYYMVGCTFYGPWLWIEPDTSYEATLTLSDGSASLSVPGVGTASGSADYFGSYDTLYVGLTGDGDWPYCSGTIDSMVVEPLN